MFNKYNQNLRHYTWEIPQYRFRSGYFRDINAVSHVISNKLKGTKR